MNPAFRDRLRAAGWHLVISIVIALLAAGMVFFVWYPDGLAGMLGGLALFFIVSASDVVLGPLISLVIFDRRKPRSELVRDYAVVAIVQLAALIYGLHVVSIARPVFVAFTGDRFEVVTALELEPSDLAEATYETYRSLPWLGPSLVGVRLPDNADEHTEALFTALGGKDLQLRPKFYADYETFRSAILSRAQPLESLVEQHSKASDFLSAATKHHGKQPGDVAWLPLRHRFGFGTALVDRRSAKPFAYLPIDPY